ncbi:hypothetical protein OF83DRAFT_1175205 [Amylostereum chailletii]|nr:hypothetical protein OF83DRAFT_1175205 [Amylostereum chailletii]
MQFTTLISALVAATSFVSASPIMLDNFIQVPRGGAPASPVSDVVVTPMVTQPAGNETYTVASVQTAKWDTSQLNEDSKEYTGSLLLGYSESGSSSEHLDISHPLASGFKLKDGQVNYTIPEVQDRNTYFVVLMGDSGNKSPEFSITH